MSFISKFRACDRVPLALYDAVCNGDEKRFNAERNNGPGELSTWTFGGLQRTILLQSEVSDDPRIPLLAKLKIPVEESVPQSEFIEFCTWKFHVGRVRVKHLLEMDPRYAFRFSPVREQQSPLATAICSENKTTAKMLLKYGASILASRKTVYAYGGSYWSETRAYGYDKDIARQRAALEVADAISKALEKRKFGCIVSIYLKILNDEALASSPVCNRNSVNTIRTSDGTPWYDDIQYGLPQVDDNGYKIDLPAYLRRLFREKLSVEERATLKEAIYKQVLPD